MIEPVRGTTPQLIGAAETRALLERHGLAPRTRLGQHFVIDPNTVRKVVRAAEVKEGETVLEIGAGVGALTLALIEAGAHVVAVERDRTLEPALREALRGHDVEIAWGDAMKLEDIGGATKMVSNLPYQVATPLVLRLLARHPDLRELTFMVQKEVGERLAAGPGDDAYGAVSVKVAWYAGAVVVGRISRTVFYPVPDVDSVIVRLRRRARPLIYERPEHVFSVVEAGFAQRRKTLRNALRGAGWVSGAVEKALAASGIEGGVRAERLSLEDFAALARALPRR